MKKITPKNGFTLIELLVVIAIIGVLASMLLPVLARAKLKANDAKAMNNMKQIAAAFQMYVGDNEETFPSNHNRNGFGPGEKLWLNYKNPEDSQILQYLGTKDIKELQRLFVNPRDKFALRRGYKYSYSMNAYLNNRSATFASPQNMAIVLEEACSHDPADRVNATDGSENSIGHRGSWRAAAINPKTGKYTGKTCREVPINDPFMLAYWRSDQKLCDPDTVTFRHMDDYPQLTEELREGKMTPERVLEVCTTPSAHVIFADYHIGLASRTEAKHPGYMDPDQNTADLPHIGLEKKR
jgi:prepilin-type N-terminal cleavage/methylation domain-containing protein